VARIETHDDTRRDPPMDIIEHVIRSQGWRFNRVEDDEMAAEFQGRWCDYSLHFAYAEEVEAIHLTCAFDVRIPERKRQLVFELLAMINDRMWLGHFSIWKDEGLPIYRHSIPLRGAEGLAPEQVEDLLDVAIAECERFYPAFQYLVWGGKSPTEAFGAAIIDPIGEA
jgi:hypothetical protein